MTRPAATDWEEIRLAWETTDEPVTDIAARTGIFHLNIHKRAKNHGWSARPGVARVPLAADVSVPACVEPDRIEPTLIAPAPVEAMASLPESSALSAEASATQAPKPRRAKSVLASRAGVQRIIDQLIRAIVRRLDILEQQLATTEIMNTQDAERIDRSMRIVMQNFEKARALDAANKPRRAARTNAAGDAASIDAQRHALAERIERFNAQWLARRVAGGLAPVGAEPAEDARAQQLVDGSSSGATAAAP